MVTKQQIETVHNVVISKGRCGYTAKRNGKTVAFDIETLRNMDAALQAQAVQEAKERTRAEYDRVNRLSEEE